MEIKYLIFLIMTMRCPLLTGGSKLLLLLLDGFRWDYFDLPGLELRGFPRLFQEGVKAEYMIPSYPTNSYPNYYTLMTGLYVENHGFVGNYMWDEATGETFELGKNPESYNRHWWEFAEPLWVTATKQGKTSYMYYWRECNISIHDTPPTYCLPYCGLPKREDVQMAMRNGVRNLKNGADSVYIYHEAIDHFGHYFGPYSRQVKDAVQRIDDDINNLLDEIKAHGLDNEINVIVFSDHGMTTVDELNKINISTAINMDDIKAISDAFSQVYIWPHSGLEDKVYNDLKALDSSHLQVHYYEDIHDRWFFKRHKRIPPIYLTTDPGWYIVHPRSDTISANYGSFLVGQHGFDNAEEDMRSIFVAKGPNFKRNFIAEGFPNVDMYQIMCKILGITPKPHNGTWEGVKDMFLESAFHSEL